MKVKNRTLTRWNGDVTCRHCKSVLEIAESDISVIKYPDPYDSYDEGYLYRYEITCQVCRRDNRLSEDQRPKNYSMYNGVMPPNIP